MMPPTHPSILEALKASQTRAGAFERFARLYRQPLVARCRGRGLQPADAEDVTQAILIRLWEALRSFDYDPERGRFRTFLAQVVRNAVADHFRERDRNLQPQATGGTTAQERLEQREDPAGAEPASLSGGGVDRLAEAVEETLGPAEWEAIARVRARVDARTWECFSLREVEGLSVEEVMQATGKREGAIYQVVYRIRKQISEEYQQVLRERGQAPEAPQP
ncbi:MAG: sigma-70 family RNA polymerase sigma factor [Gemmataceae bacterium]|nr:sigma-70 family RNA polymerase sigma factor [Gemmataceae bacterium]